MTTSQWQRLSSIYHEALARPAEERHVYVRDTCGDDAALQQEVEALLAADGAAALVDTPALDIAARGLASEGPSLIGRRLGAYQVLAFLGAGGMGEVYRARDTKLGREVALKVLPASVAADASWLTRFRREAMLLAAVNHPNIGAIYGLEESDGISALVLELVEGPTLSDRLADGPLPADETLAIARQVADALEAAHDRGIVHRDLKPANIVVTTSGTVKVLDFGLAKAVSDGRAPDRSALPTLASGTQRGVILGTAAYMSPEQARGLPVDKRADVWAFGCVLYEMVTGRAAFQRTSVSDTLAAVLTADADWSLLPPGMPESLRHVLRRCLQKDAARRLRDMGDARLEIEEAVSTAPSVAEPPARHPRNRRERLAWGVAAFCLVLLAIGAYLMPMRQPAAVVRFDITTSPTTDPASFALSADGRKLAYVATADGAPRLWVRSLDQVAAQVQPGTEGASYPFWAPDNSAIGFFADGKVKRIDREGGAVQVLADAPNGRGRAWSRDDVIVFAPTNMLFSPRSVLMRVPASGGSSEPVTHLLPGERNHRFPQFLPDGRRFLFLSLGGAAGGIHVGSLDGGEAVKVTSDSAAAEFAPPGALLVVRQGTLVALPFDHERAVINGAPIPVIASVASNFGAGRDGFTVSANGVLAHRAECAATTAGVDGSGGCRAGDGLRIG